MASEAALPLRGQKRGRAAINTDLGLPALGLPARKSTVGKAQARGRALNLTPERFAEKSRPNDLFFVPMPQHLMPAAFGAAQPFREPAAVTLAGSSAPSTARSGVDHLAAESA
jgi:hypothetical protein